MPGLARLLFTIAGCLVVAGVLVVALNRMQLPLGRLPGDLSWRGRGWSVSVPLDTSLLLSVILSVILWAIGRLR